LTYLIPKLINGQITLGNKYEMETTRNVIVTVSGSKPLMEVTINKTIKNKNMKVLL